MCVILDTKLTAKLRAKGGTIRAWKLLERYSGHLQSPMYGSMVYQPGINIAWVNGRKPGGTGLCEFERHSETVHYGIHVFLNRTGAKNYCSGDRVVVPVTCAAKDLRGAGVFGDDWNIKQAAFTQVRISPAQYRKALKGDK